MLRLLRHRAPCGENTAPGRRLSARNEPLMKKTRSRQSRSSKGKESSLSSSPLPRHAPTVMQCNRGVLVEVFVKSCNLVHRARGNAARDGARHSKRTIRRMV